MRELTISFFLFSLIIFISCSHKRPESAGTSFYYWKQKFSLSEMEKAILKKEQVSRLYLRFFDVASKGPDYSLVSHADISIVDSLSLKGIEVIPCVFITNNVFNTISIEEVDSLAHKVAARILAHCRANYFLKVRELQIDCDWNKSTKNNYFHFLETIQKLQPFPVSTTIRLHQVKFKSATGVPPVKNGVLMCYNMSPPQKYGVQNSLFDFKVLQSYTKNLNEYPIKLDVGFPIYSWGVLFRKKKFAGFINHLTYEELSASKDFSWADKKIATCINSCRYKNELIYKGDEIRIEDVDDLDLQKAREWIADKLPYSWYSIYYHLEQNNITRHEKIFSSGTSDF